MWCHTKPVQSHSLQSLILDRTQSHSTPDWKSLFKKNLLWSPSSMKRMSIPMSFKHTWRNMVGALIKSNHNKAELSRRIGQGILLEWPLSLSFSLNLERWAKVNKDPKERVRTSLVTIRCAHLWFRTRANKLTRVATLIRVSLVFSKQTHSQIEHSRTRKPSRRWLWVSKEIRSSHYFSGQWRKQVSSSIQHRRSWTSLLDPWESHLRWAREYQVIIS